VGEEFFPWPYAFPLDTEDTFVRESESEQLLEVVGNYIECLICSIADNNRNTFAGECILFLFLKKEIFRG